MACDLTLGLTLGRTGYRCPNFLVGLGQFHHNAVFPSEDGPPSASFAQQLAALGTNMLRLVGAVLTAHMAPLAITADVFDSENPQGCYKKILICTLVPLVMAPLVVLAEGLLFLYALLLLPIYSIMALVESCCCRSNPDSFDAERRDDDSVVSRTPPRGYYAPRAYYVGGRSGWSVERL